MNKLRYLILATIIALLGTYLLLKNLQPDNSFYQITCNQGDDEVQYISLKEEKGKYLIDGEYKEFKGCKAIKIEPKNP